MPSSAWLTKSEEDFKHLEGSEYKDFGHEGNMTCVSAAFNCHLGAVDYHDAYAKNEAEDFNFVRNAPVTYENNGDEDNGGMVGPMKSKYYIGYRHVDFGKKPASHIDLRAKITLGSTSIDVYLDEPNTTNGTLLCSIKGNELAALKAWDSIRKMINQPVTGVHNVYFVSTGSGLTNLNWWQFQSLNTVYADLTNGGGSLTTSFAAINPSSLLDGDITTSCNSPIEGGADTWIQYTSPSPMRIYGYQFFSGSDSAGNPKGWSLQASNDGKNWETLHTVSDVTISVRGQCFYEELETAKDYTHYRLLFDMDETQTKLSVSEWQLIGRCIDEYDLTADGGTITEGMEALIDHIGATSSQAPLTAVFQPAGNYTLSAYSITIGDASQAPTSWKLEGSANGSTGWKIIDQQTLADFQYDNSTNVYRVNPATSYLYYRLTVNGEEKQICQWQLFGQYDFGKFFADITSIATIKSSDGSDASALTDKDGSTYASLSGDQPFWNISTPIPVKVIGYSLVSADKAELDPKNITLYGIDDDGIETQIFNKALSFPARGSRLTYTASSTKLFKSFRLKVNQMEGASTRLADFELYSTTIAEADDPNLVVPTVVEATAPAISSTEEISRINDGSRTTQYRANFTEPVSITYSFADTVSINAYSITASKNEPTRDPANWKLEASNDGETWVLLDSRNGETFSNRYATQFYTFEVKKKYNTYRLTVTAINGGNQLQIGEFQLLNIQPVEPTGIQEIAYGKWSMNGQWYNLAGQRLSKPQRGINIINGKKLLIQ